MEIQETSLAYLQRGQRGVFSEIYFPRRVVAQGTIFDALENGFHESRVKEYLKGNTKALLGELLAHRQFFDPHWYDTSEIKRQVLTAQDIKSRIEQYVSPFFGWSNYVTDGVFWSKERQEMVEESTQIVRLMFLFESSFISEAEQAQCQDVLRSMLFWIIARQARLSHIPRWHKAELKRFIRDHEPFKKKKLVFAKKFFEPVAKEIFKWRGDWFLFVFGYLVRQFAAQLTARGKPEEEIWIASFFNLTISAIVKTSQQS